MDVERERWKAEEIRQRLDCPTQNRDGSEERIPHV